VEEKTSIFSGLEGFGGQDASQQLPKELVYKTDY
jgi:hypothetical protein